MTTDQTHIALSIPLKANQVSLVRLATSGIASQIGFDIDAIEDIKVSISEVCNKLIAKYASEEARLNLNFSFNAEQITISFEVPGSNIGNLFDDDSDAFALAILSSLMDEVETAGDNGTIRMTKAAGRAD